MSKSIMPGYDLEMNYLDMLKINFALALVVPYRTDLDHELPQIIAQMIERHQ